MQENNEQLSDHIKKFIIKEVAKAAAESYRSLDNHIEKDITGAAGRILKDQDKKLAEMRTQLKEELQSLLKEELQSLIREELQSLLKEEFKSLIKEELQSLLKEEFKSTKNDEQEE
jgi:hypothetical protein